jgi:hypothetical protein
MEFGLGVTRRGEAALILGGNLGAIRTVELASEFLFVAAAAVENGRLKNNKLRRTTFHIADFSCEEN